MLTSFFETDISSSYLPFALLKIYKNGCAESNIGNLNKIFIERVHANWFAES